VLIDDLLLAGAFAALLEQLYGILAFSFRHDAFISTLAQPVFWGNPPKRPPVDSPSQYSVRSLPLEGHSEQGLI
jgi:hypothetical protein